MTRLTWTWILLAAATILAPQIALAESGADTHPVLTGSCLVNNATLEKLYPTTTVAGCKPDVTIPSNKRWVIELVQARCTLDGDTTPPMITSVQFMPFRQVSAAGYDGLPLFLTDWQSTSGQMLDVVRRVWIGTLKGPIYTDLAPRFDAERLSGVLSYAACKFSASGYLVDRLQ